MQLFYVIPQSHCVIIERFGKFNRIQHEGIRFRFPSFEKIKRVDSWGDIANQRGFLVELTEQQTDTPARTCHTKDNVQVKANASIYWRITDPAKAIYEVDVLPESIRDVSLNALRSNIGSMELDAVLSNRTQLNELVSAQLSDTAAKWGVIFTRVEVQELQTEENVEEAMLQQMDAERHRRAQIAEAEGKAKATVTIAEAERDAAIMRAEGRAKALQMTAEAEQQYLQQLSETAGSKEAVELLLAQKYIDGFETISKNPADKVFIPNNFNAVYSLGTESNSKPSTDQTE
jgi:regulator of protease activity HflC (stomatin/prohibitin superfamily)